MLDCTGLGPTGPNPSMRDSPAQMRRIVTTSAWCGPDSDPETILTELAGLVQAEYGDHLEGDIRFIVVAGADAQQHLDRLRNSAGSDVAQIEHYRHLRAKLREYGGGIQASTDQRAWP